MQSADQIRSRLEGSLAVIASVRDHTDKIVAIADMLRQQFAAGGKLFTCGNGGSAAHALHLAEELIGRYRSNRKPYPAICLNGDPTALTCIANDFGFEHVFARQCQTLLGPHDVLLVLSTSGNSANLVHALRIARERRASTIGLLGKGGGECATLCDHAIIVTDAHGDSAFIQDAHQVIIHLICESLETAV